MGWNGDGMGWDGMGWDGMGWDGMGWDGMGWDGMGWDGMGWDRNAIIELGKEYLVGSTPQWLDVAWAPDAYLALRSWSPVNPLSTPVHPQVNCDDEQELANQWGIEAIPTLALYHDGEEYVVVFRPSQTCAFRRLRLPTTTGSTMKTLHPGRTGASGLCLRDNCSRLCCSMWTTQSRWIDKADHRLPSIAWT